MAAFATFLAKISPSKSAIFRKSLITEHKSVSIKVAAVSLRSEFNKSVTDQTEFTSILYSTPLESSFVIPFTTSTQEYELQNAVEKIREIMALETGNGDGLEELIMIDSIQRLGLGYYFKEEFHAVFERHYEVFCTLDEGGCDNLHEYALRFRLLRQEGYNLSADAFKKFKDKNGKFKQELCKDTKGLVSLFEASHLGIQGDDILDEANDFSAQLLNFSLNNTTQAEATMIVSTLRNPYLRSLPTLMARNFFNSLEPSLKFLHNFEDKHGWTSPVRALARMDFGMAQITNQGEITQVHRWRKGLNLTKELKRVRDQPVKWHIWSMAALPNPTMKEERIELTKSISLIYLIDDIFDIYGTLEELILFTEAVSRWKSDIEGLPNSMKICLKALLDTTDEISHKIYRKHGYDPKASLQKAWVDLCNAFLVEAKWFASGNLPSAEDYLKNGLVSSGMHVAAVHIFYLLGQGINSESIDLLNSFPDLVSSMATILRLSDDLGSAKDENQVGYDGSFIDCYNNEHKDSSAESAQDIANRLISEAWKCLNKMCLCPSPFSADFTASCFNITRVVPMMYGYDHNPVFRSLKST